MTCVQKAAKFGLELLDLKLSRPTVRKHCRTQSDPAYHRSKQPTPMLGAFQETLETWLQTERLLPKR